MLSKGLLTTLRKWKCYLCTKLSRIGLVPLKHICQIHKAFGIKKTRTHWRRVKSLGQHQVGVNFQSHAQHQLWISTWWKTCIPQNDARLKLSWKFDESKYGTKYVLNEHLNFSQYDPYAIPSEIYCDTAVLQVSRIKLKPWLIYCINDLIKH